MNRMQNRGRELPPIDALIMEARRIYRYDQERGGLIWDCLTNDKVKRIKIGDTVGGDDGHGYKSCRVLGHKFKVHQVVWLLCNGELPWLPLDHINCDRSDNRIENLRLATDQQNMWNRPLNGGRRVSGVSKVSGRTGWAARIEQDGRKRYLGYFPTREAAEAAYSAACNSIRGEFAPQIVGTDFGRAFTPPAAPNDHH